MDVTKCDVGHKDRLQQAGTGGQTDHGEIYARHVAAR